MIVDARLIRDSVLWRQLLVVPNKLHINLSPDML